MAKAHRGSHAMSVKAGEKHLQGRNLLLSFQVLCLLSKLFPLWNNLEEHTPEKFIAHDNLKGDQVLKQKFIKIHSYSVYRQKNVQSPQHQAMNSILRSVLQEDQILALPPKRFFCFYSCKWCIYYITSPEQSFETPKPLRRVKKTFSRMQSFLTEV